VPRNATVLAALALLAGFAFVAGCGGEPVNRLADEPDQLVLYSIDGPSWFKNEGELTPDQAKGEVLHGYPVLGKIEVTDPGRRREVIAAVKEAVRTNSEPEHKCFIPRHAVRTVKAGVTIDVVICFQCRNYEAYRGSEKSMSGKGRISSAARPLLDQALADAGVTLAPKD
jgi:hypothetical protein